MSQTQHATDQSEARERSMTVSASAILLAFLPSSRRSSSLCTAADQFCCNADAKAYIDLCLFPRHVRAESLAVQLLLAKFKDPGLAAPPIASNFSAAPLIALAWSFVCGSKSRFYWTRACAVLIPF